MSDLLELHETQVSGVPAYWVRGPEPLVAGLVFGVGMADESLLQRGMSHLVEHTALEGLSARQLTFNGTVDESTTTFWVSGSDEEVIGFLERTASRLSELPMHDLDRELRVLRTEAASRGVSPLGSHASVRWGPHGLGRLQYPELAFHGAAESAVRAWSSRWFTRGNAALWFSGPPPAGLQVSLPEGERPGPEPDLPSVQVQLPGWYHTGANLVALSFESERTQAHRLSLSVLDHAVEDRLRHTDGHSYAVAGSNLVSRSQRMHLIAADCRPDEAEDVQRAMAAELARLNSAGPTDEEMADARALFRRGCTDIRAAAAMAKAAADAHVLGLPPVTATAALEASMTVSAADVAGAIRGVRDSIVWSLPWGADMQDRRYHSIDRPTDDVLDGRRWTLARRAPGAPDETLVIGDEGACIVQEGRAWATVRWPGVAAALQWADDSWVLYGRDGQSIVVRADTWSDFDSAAAAIRQHVPTNLVVTSVEALTSGDPPGEPVAGATTAGAPPPPTPSATPSGEPERPGAPAKSGSSALRAVLATVVLLGAAFLASAALGPQSQPDSGVGNGYIIAARIVLGVLALGFAGLGVFILRRR